MRVNMQLRAWFEKGASKSEMVPAERFELSNTCF